MAAASERVCWKCGNDCARNTTCQSCGTEHRDGAYLPTHAEFAKVGGGVLTGTVKWFSDDKGFGFITTDDGTDVFVHHSAIVADGYRALAEGEGVELGLERGPKGLNAARVSSRRRSPGPDPAEPDPPPAAEHVLLIDDNGAIRMLPCIHGPTGHIIVDSTQLRSVLADAALPTSTSTSHRVQLWKACAEFERLVNSSAPESALQEFFERHPDFLLGDDYEALYPQVVLPMGVTGSTLRPDFILKPFAGVSYEPAIVELKLPAQPLIKARSGHTALYAQVHDAVSQLRAYAEAFEQPDIRQRFHDKVGFAPYRPKLALIVGRSQNLPNQRVAAIARESIQPVELQTYDDILVRYRRRIGLGS